MANCGNCGHQIGRVGKSVNLWSTHTGAKEYVCRHTHTHNTIVCTETAGGLVVPVTCGVCSKAHKQTYRRLNDFPAIGFPRWLAHDTTFSQPHISPVCPWPCARHSTDATVKTDRTDIGVCGMVIGKLCRFSKWFRNISGLGSGFVLQIAGALCFCRSNPETVIGLRWYCSEGS